MILTVNGYDHVVRAIVQHLKLRLGARHTYDGIPGLRCIQLMNAPLLRKQHHFFDTRQRFIGRCSSYTNWNINLMLCEPIGCRIKGALLFRPLRPVYRTEGFVKNITLDGTRATGAERWRLLVMRRYYYKGDFA